MSAPQPSPTRPGCMSPPSRRIRGPTSTSRRRGWAIRSEMLTRAPTRHAAYVGASAFAHKAGLHVAAVEKDPRTYEHIPPERVGNQRHILVSDQAGRAHILSRLREGGGELA